MTKKTDWSEFYKNTKSAPPSPLLIKALEYVPKKDKAIDIGGGALKDSRYLLEQGFDVTVLDMDPGMAQIAKEISSDRLHYVISSFADFAFPKQTFDIASAMFSLPFNPPDSFEAVIASIKQCLVPGGIFCGQFFGVRDQWSSNPSMTFHTKDQAEGLLADMEVLALTEKEYDGNLADRSPKHWHLFHFITRKR